MNYCPQEQQMRPFPDTLPETPHFSRGPFDENHPPHATAFTFHPTQTHFQAPFQQPQQQFQPFQSQFTPFPQTYTGNFQCFPSQHNQFQQPTPFNQQKQNYNFENLPPTQFYNTYSQPQSLIYQDFPAKPLEDLNGRKRNPEKKPKSDFILEMKIIFRVTVIIGSTNQELQLKLTVLLNPDQTVQCLKMEILKQLYCLHLVDSTMIDDYILYSQVVYEGLILEGGQSINLILQNWNSDLNRAVDMTFVFSNCNFKLTKKGYSSLPKQEDLEQMSLEELSRVLDFQVSNRFGSVVWPGHTDLRFVDMDDIIEILQFDIMMYHKQLPSMAPRVGEKLNKKCYCEFRVSLDTLQEDYKCKNSSEMELFISQKMIEKNMMFANPEPQKKLITLGKEINCFTEETQI